MFYCSKMDKTSVNYLTKICKLLDVNYLTPCPESSENLPEKKITGP